VTKNGRAAAGPSELWWCERCNIAYASIEWFPSIVAHDTPVAMLRDQHKAAHRVWL